MRILILAPEGGFTPPASPPERGALIAELLGIGALAEYYLDQDLAGGGGVKPPILPSPASFHASTSPGPSRSVARFHLALLDVGSRLALFT